MIYSIDYYHEIECHVHSMSEQFLKRVEKSGWGIEDLELPDMGSLETALCDMRRDIESPSLPDDYVGIARIHHLPTSCLKLHLQPTIRYIFCQLLQTQNIVNTYEVAQCVQVGEKQSYTGTRLMALLPLTEQKIKGNHIISPGDLLVYDTTRIDASSLFVENESGQPWYGLFISYCRVEDHVVDRCSRINRFLKGQFCMNFSVSCTKAIFTELIKERLQLLRKLNSYHRFFIDGMVDMNDETQLTIKHFIPTEMAYTNQMDVTVISCPLSDMNEEQHIQRETAEQILEDITDIVRGSLHLEERLQRLKGNDILTAWTRKNGCQAFEPFLWNGPIPSFQVFVNHMFKQILYLVELLYLVRYNHTLVYQLAFGFQYIIGPLKEVFKDKMTTELWESMSQMKALVGDIVSPMKFMCYEGDVIIQDTTMSSVFHKFITSNENVILLEPIQYNKM